MKDNVCYNLSSALGITEIKQYLINNQWKLDESFPNKKVKLFKRKFNSDEDEEEFQILVPVKKTFSDFNIRVFDIVESLSVLEEKDKEEIISEIRSVNVDIFEMRLIDDDFDKGNISINIADSITTFIKDIIVSSACVEENPRPVYVKPTKKAMNYANIFELGQTKVGSYVLTIQSDLSDNLVVNDDVDLEDEIPFQRRIIKRLQRALYQLNNSQDDYSEFIKKCYKDGLNGNMCEILSKLKDIKDKITIEYTFNISKTISDNDSIPTKFKLNNETFCLAQKLAERFKELQKSEEVSICGKVKSIDFDTENPDIKSAYVTVNFFYELDRRYHNVKLYLEDDNFNLACDALRDQKDVSVKGTLDRSARKWCIDNIETFTII